jgi:hypothetical protein
MIMRTAFTHQQKYKNTAWLIVVGIILLNYHASTRLCTSGSQEIAYDVENLFKNPLEDERYCRWFGSDLVINYCLVIV